MVYGYPASAGWESLGEEEDFDMLDLLFGCGPKSMPLTLPPTPGS